MLETKRLVLVPLSHEQLCLFKDNPEGLARNLGVGKVEPYDDPETATHVEEAIQFWLENTKQHPLNFAWYTNWVIILKATACVIGGIGFSGFPQAHGKTMVGYGMNTKYFGRGYASEALRALTVWGFRQPELKSIIAETPIKHIGSQRVLIKNGFTETNRDNQLIHWELNEPMTT